MKRKIIVILIILMCFIICGLTFSIILLKNNKTNNFKLFNMLIIAEIDEEMKEESPTLMIDTSYTILDSQNIIYTIQDCINNYHKYILEKDNDAVYSMLNEKYISQNNITNENIFTKVKNIQDFQQVWVDKIYYKVIDFDKEIQYHIKYTVLSKEYTIKQERYIIVNVDFINETYSITPCDDFDYSIITFEQIMEKLIENDDGKTVPASEVSGKRTEILRNKYNKFLIRNKTDIEIVKEYVDRYKTNAIYFPQDAYNMLDIEYRNQKFSNVEDYISYTQQTINKLEAYQYNVKRYDGYIEYINIDKEGKKVIFKEILPMQFTVQLEY